MLDNKTTQIKKINNIPYREKRTIRDSIVPGNVYLCQLIQYNKTEGYYVDYQPVLVVGKTADGDVNFLQMKPTANAKISKDETEYKSNIEVNCDELPHKKYYVCANKINNCADELFFSKPIYRFQAVQPKIYQDILLNMEKGFSTSVSKYINDKYMSIKVNEKDKFILSKILKARVKFLESKLNEIVAFGKNITEQKGIQETLKAMQMSDRTKSSTERQFDSHGNNEDVRNPLKPEETINKLNNIFSSAHGKKMKENDIQKLIEITKKEDLIDKRLDKEKDYRPVDEIEKQWMKYDIPILPDSEKINLIQPGMVYPCEIFAKNKETKEYEIKSRPVLVIGQVSKNEVQIIHITTKRKLGKEKEDMIKHIGHKLEKDRLEQNANKNIENPSSFKTTSWLNAEKVETVPIECILPLPTSYATENKIEYRNRFLNIIYHAEKNIISEIAKKIQEAGNTNTIKKHKNFLEKEWAKTNKIISQLLGNTNKDDGSERTNTQVSKGKILSRNKYHQNDKSNEER